LQTLCHFTPNLPCKDTCKFGPGCAHLLPVRALASTHGYILYV
jgi:hypothetical protein